ncbi:MAG: hypothetical protein PHN49_03160 [Candidatus Omnitrophica bacterium]|nr:hypothetical protein [Candidatus Omnitrophota bacterium]MDD5670619.1 hypothetical protein [Candidatus Omnitrophota bacterium]
MSFTKYVTPECLQLVIKIMEEGLRQANAPDGDRSKIWSVELELI